MRLLAYHLRLAVRSLARTRGYSITMVVCLAIAGSFWTQAITHYLRMYGPSVAARASLHHLEIDHLRPHEGAVPVTHSGQVMYAWRTRLSYGEYRAVSGTGIPDEEIALARGQVVLGRHRERPEGLAAARFVDGGFFAAFQRRMRWGRGWTAAERTPIADEGPPVVLGRATNARLFDGENSVGRVVYVDGHRSVVVGVLADDQPYRPDWDVAMTGADQDALYLPFAWLERLQVWPETVVGTPPAGSSFATLLASHAYFVTFWIDLRTPAQRTAYERFLSRRVGAGHTLRSYREFSKTFALPNSPISFFALLGALVLLSGGFNLVRLQMAKSIARSCEIGIHRALGARRRSVFARQLIESGLVALAGAGLALVFTAPLLWGWHGLVGDSDVPMRLTALSAVASVGGVGLVGLASGLYPAWRLSRVPPTLALRRL